MAITVNRGYVKLAMIGLLTMISAPSVAFAERKFLSLVNTGTVLASLLVVAGVAGPARAADCAGQAVAEIYSKTVAGMEPMVFTFEQSAALRRIGTGPGLDGDWIITNWTIVTTLPMADPQFASRGGMVPVPEWAGDCHGSALGTTTFLNECSGAIPLVVQSGVIRYKGADAPIGSIKGTMGGKPKMTLNILPNEGGFDWTMVGPVDAYLVPEFAFQVVEHHMVTQGGLGGHLFDFNVRVSPADTDIVDSLVLSLNQAAGGPWANATTSHTPLGGTIKVTLLGETPGQRTASARKSWVTATVERAGCEASRTWKVIDLLFATGVIP